MVIPAGREPRETALPAPTGPTLGTCPCSAQQQRGGGCVLLSPPTPCSEGKSTQKKVHWVEHTYNFPSNTPLPFPSQIVEGNSGSSETHPNMTAGQHTYTHTHRHTHRALLGRWHSAGRGLDKSTGAGRGGIFLPAPSRGSPSTGGNTHMHTSAPQTEDGSMGLGPSPGDGEQFQSPGREVGWESVHLWLQMWLLPRLKKTSPNQLQILVSQLQALGSCV